LLSGFSSEQMRAITYVPERYIKQLQGVREFQVRLGDGRELTSNDIKVFSFAEPKTHSYQVRINLPANQAHIQPGTWAKASVKLGESQKIQLPVSALITMNELSSVYRQQGDSFVLTQVRITEPVNGEVEVLAGLKAGDLVALDAYQVLLKKQ
ncbi:MAG: efflux RND transporter periplasmic adaptor subunit, partial [Shewanella sp.]